MIVSLKRTDPFEGRSMVGMLDYALEIAWPGVSIDVLNSIAIRASMYLARNNLEVVQQDTDGEEG